MTTINAVNNGLSGSTGTGSFVGGNQPTLNQANLVGTLTNDSAAAGSVGEFVSSTLAAGSAISLTNNTADNITSISLTAGDWDVWGMGINICAAGTLVAFFEAGINTTSATIPTTSPTTPLNSIGLGTGTTVNYSLNTGVGRISLASTTTIYLVTLATFSVSTLTAYGWIAARRVR